MSLLPTKIPVFLLFSAPLKPQTSNSEGYNMLVFTMANKPAVFVFHNAAMAAAEMRREEDSSASLHHLIKHTLHRPVLMKMTYMSPLNLIKSQEWVFSILHCEHWDYFFGLKFLAALWSLCSEWSQSVLWLIFLLTLWLTWLQLK